jgi:carbamate kinase
VIRMIDTQHIQSVWNVGMINTLVAGGGGVLVVVEEEENHSPSVLLLATIDRYSTYILHGE